MKELHLIEPTLYDQTGHGFSYNSSIIAANTNMFKLHIWLDQRGKQLFAKDNCITHGYFSRRWRRVQKLFLYSKLLKQDIVIYLGTAEFTDLLFMYWLTKYLKSKAKIFLHFHQFRQTTAKLTTLQKIAQTKAQFYFITPTQKLTKIFQIAGFSHCLTIGCPSFSYNSLKINDASKFAKVLYAGAARKDKGFPTIVKLVEYITQEKLELPFAIQISPPNSGHYDAATTIALEKLVVIQNPNITLYRHTLNQTQYQELFTNAICLLVYDAISYQDKFSGVVLDACYAACPIITIANTWMADTVNRFKLGIVLATCEPRDILAAIYAIQKDYEFYVTNAKQAAVVLATEHDPKNTLLAIQQNIGELID